MPKFGEVELPSLTQKAFPEDTSAVAAILYDVGETHFTDELNIEFKRRIRIKIYKKEGFSWATLVIPLYVKNKPIVERLESLKAVSLNYDNGQITWQEIDKKDIFTEKYDEYIDLVKATVPNVREGTVIEFEYVVFTPYEVNLPDWNFQYSIPVVWSEYKVVLPPFYNYQMVGTGFEKLFLNESKATNYERKIGPYTFNESEYRLALKNVPAFKEEPFMTSEKNYRARMDFQLASVNFPNRLARNYITTWPELIQKVLKDYSIGEYLDDRATKDQALEIAAAHSSPLARAKSIYEFVRNRFKRDGWFNTQLRQSPEALLTSLTGNVSEINILLCNMLRQAGLTAHPVVLSTRDNDQVKISYPLWEDFNYAVVLQEAEGQRFLLDASNPLLVFGMLRPECINGFGLLLALEKGGTESWIDLKQALEYDYRTNVLMRYQPDTQSYTQQVSLLLGQYAAWEARHENLNSEFIKSRYASANPSEIKIENGQDISKGLSTRFKGESDLEAQADILYISLPFLPDILLENPFKNPVRTFPVDFNYKRAYSYLLNIEVPPGYAV
ncbi:MAG: hypothetical protein OHK0053_19910 [Microscillaceae bacterium]